MIVILSDIHGNLPALDAVLSDINFNSVEKLICLGDVAGYYPFVNECIQRLIDHQAINLMGNHDFYLTSGLGCPRSKSVNELSTLFSSSVSDKCMSYLRNSPVSFSLDDAIMVHGGFRDPIDEYLYSLSQEYFEGYPYKYFFSGHTHVQHVEFFDNGQVYCNPGAVGQPRDGNPSAAYAIFEPKSGNIALKRVEYDPESIFKYLREHGFDRYFYENLNKGTRIGGKTDSIRRK
ncbi:metallophosphoesterase [Vibrio amylolyticus]|uniref:metallophosphoesterase family protein n=1 Tax=Vibrio amylolyticus TaxID=2847292 RepID=UPI00354EC8D1